MYVSMNPKGETGKVIHISQNDTNREVEFIPFDQNGLTPLTDGQLTARINSIKGNTVSFNQLVQNGNFADTTGWSATRGTISASNNVLTYTITEIGTTYIHNRIGTPFVTVIGHKYFLTATVKPKYTNRLSLRFNGSDDDVVHFSDITANSWNYLAGIITPVGVSGQAQVAFNTISNYSVGDTIQVQNYMVFDLTLMGIDNLTTTAEVEQWLSSHIGDLPYYDYTQGTLISFNGTGLKTVGFNQWDEEWEEGDISESTGENVNSNSRWRTTNYISIFPFTDYYIKTNYSSVALRGRFYDADKNYIGSAPYGATYLYSDEIFKTPQNAYYMRFSPNNSVFPDHMACVNISNAEKNGTYEPYTSNTLSLPTSTYFPFGEDGIGTVRDELIPNSDVYKRIGIVDMGNLPWAAEQIGSSGVYRMKVAISDIKSISSSSRIANMICGIYETISADSTYGRNKGISLNGQNVYVYDENYNTSSSASSFKTAMQGQYLVYELATPLHNYGVVDLGSLNWKASASANNYEMYSDEIVGAKPASSNSSIANIVCSKYKTSSRSGGSGTYNEVTGIAIGTNGYVYVYDPNYNTSSSTSAFKTAMSGVYLLYELETPVAPSSMEDTYPIWNGGTEQILPVNTSTPTTSPIKANITYPDRTEDTEFLYKQTSFEWIYKSWAFVCKNITQALSVVGNALKGTIPGTMTNESGKFPLKLKMTDNDGVCFSEKIDLFVEKKP